MKKFGLRNFASLALVAAALVVPTTAMADDVPPPPGTGYYYFNDGAGTCGYAQQTPWGWQVVMTFPCPREVSGG
jgi:hypothetical protein